ncbi:glycosyl transferase, family 2/macrocin-O-methyltransferase family protein [Rhodobacter capsulatus SB 1003]|uniref:Glycosyl transferase, family 2/macrocin-O-methyltransferase family protein n=1 Tax=Rhodobacter capsulatus (strain ATCC BAA-309 / NBRC 16581 / SB1003) TaxID=272942 RepID=D5ALV4_RHOCB|nr:TylF/MycF/NovP-related O-methyltransferase [Rhodobacter capsulatus]ADE86165.1 glycosyl transferase, family 2/macrocin-O-methyltransferase family protein [Rhodobacter capsulatus SB 1003]
MTRKPPELSLIVISHEMARELPRTLYSLSPRYQEGIAAEDYEVIVIDNGSRQPPRAEDFADLGLNLRIERFADPTPSPVRAINHGLGLAAAPLIGVSIDGARMASPGLLEACRRAARTDPMPVVSTLSFQIGPGPQWLTQQQGYDSAWEDRLLAGIDWQADGYRLFDISPFAENVRRGWFGPLSESNLLFLPRALWEALGGFDPAFESPGGGAANADLLWRALEHPGTRQVVVLGEGIFHQIHGGTHTNAGAAALEVHKRAAKEYYRLRGRIRVVDTERSYFGPVSRRAAEVYARQLAAAQTAPPRAAATPLRPGPEAGERYLDLLKAVLLNETGLETEVALDALRGRKDIPPAFWSETLYDVPGQLAPALAEKRRLRAQGLDTLTAQAGPPLGYTMIGRRRLDHLQDCVATVLAEAVPGDLMECGVWRGGACLLMKAMLDLAGAQDRSLWVADSFAGLPPPALPEDEGLDLSRERAPALAVSQARVERAFADFGLLDARVRFLPGFFADTLAGCAVEKLALLRLDGDLYSSTLQALEALYDRVAPGGFVIIDDYGALGQCALAVDRFRAARGITAPLGMIDWTGAFWRKS